MLSKLENEIARFRTNPNQMICTTQVHGVASVAAVPFPCHCKTAPTIIFVFQEERIRNMVEDILFLAKVPKLRSGVVLFEVQARSQGLEGACEILIPIGVVNTQAAAALSERRRRLT